MVDRYTLTLKADELALTLGAEVPEEYSTHFNAAPSKRLPIITSQNRHLLSFFHWGLISNLSNNKSMSPKFFNLPVDSVMTKTSYKRKLATHRCVIPMDGFYVWKQVAKKQVIPHYFFFPDKKVFSIAGIWEESEDSSGSFIMITQKANGQLSSFQEDMPAILNAAETRKWLESNDVNELGDLLQTSKNEQMISHNVSPKIRDIELNDVSLIKPAAASDQHGNYTLFS
ncbi:MAG: SOS response-associated peptidase [Ekhidna sp.]